MGKPISVADPAFPRRGRQSQKGRQPIICQIFCRKMHENEKKKLDKEGVLSRENCQFLCNLRFYPMRMHKVPE